ncbi:Transferrin [Papilio machaon]|uniref:Transferrin n=1 Tax=Papilio machaon TaxID=76193 RepID=A0A0N1IPG6_PAPMA|nr:Transferrin [Papilio machaon]
MDLTTLVSRTFLTLNRITELSVMETRTGREVRSLRPQRRRCLYNDEPVGKDRQVGQLIHVPTQVNRVCISTSNPVLCQSLDKDGSRAVCQPVESRIDCALRLARNSVDVGVFSEEEMMLLSQMQPNDNRVVATIRDVNRQEPYAFEAVAIVPNSHTGGLEGLRGGNYCHPGFDEAEVRWSPRVLKTFERVVARTDRCPDANVAGKTAEELELETLSQFFPRACRPGPWSANTTVDTNLKGRFSSLCSLCGENSGCSGYTLDMGVNVAGVSNTNRHIQALECLRRSGNNSVAYVAWQHVREYFTSRNPQDAEQYSLLCEDGTLSPLTPDVLSALTSPCAFVRQPWSAIVATSSIASTVQASMRSWWPNGANPGGNNWQAILFSGIIGGTNARVIFDDTLPSPANYTSAVRNITSIDATTSCLPARRWCTISAQEHTKCTWVRSAAYTLGIEPTVSCQQRTNTFECLQDIKEERADFIATPANYGYISRQHYQLSALKLVQNTRSDPAAFSRVVALIKDSAQENITRFENLRNKKACFPEYGGIVTCAYDYTNMYYGNNGSLSCLADPETDVAFVEMQNINSQLSSLGLQGSQFRALCRNNTLAVTNGTLGIDQACLLAYVVDSELLARRSDPLLNSLSVLLDNLDQYFGYNAASGTQHINLEMYSAFDGINDLLFKNTAVGLSEPSTETANEPARNYIELFKHLDACTSVAPPSLAKAAHKECKSTSESESSSSSSSSTLVTYCAEKSDSDTEKEPDCDAEKSESDCAQEKSETDCAEKTKSETEWKIKIHIPPRVKCNTKTQTYIESNKADCDTEKTETMKKDCTKKEFTNANTQTEEIALDESAISCTIESETADDKLADFYNAVSQHWDG